MKKPVDFEKEKRRLQRRRRAKRLFLFTLIIVLAVFGYIYRYEIASQGFGVLISDTFTSLTRSSEFPIALSQQPQQLLCAGRRPAVCTAGTITVYNPVGEEKISERLGSADVLAKSCGNYLLVYTRGGYDLRVFSGETELFRLKTENVIESAALAKNGAVAVATAQGAASNVAVYSRRYNKVFEWNTSAFSVTAMALDSSAQTLCVGGAWSDGGMLCSSLREFSVLSGEEMQSRSFSDELLLEVCVRTDSQVCAVTDRAAYLLPQEGTGKRLEFSSQLVGYAMFSDGSFACATGSYDASREIDVVRTDSSFAVTATVAVEQDVKRLLPYGDELLLFTGERVLRCSKSLERTAVLETEGALQAAAAGGSLYYTTVEQLCRLSLK